MIKLLADANIIGHLERLTWHMKSEPWVEFWEYCHVQCLTFADLGLATEASDDVVWQVCQAREIVLLTSNRNHDGPNSLEATIRHHGNARSLPVFTFGDADRILSDHDYAERVVDSLFEYLLNIDQFRGTGRLYLP